MTDAGDDPHTLVRYFTTGDMHRAQCTCGETFKAPTERDVMAQHFRHAWAKVNARRGGE